jgi:ribosomal protein S18 acetylase RimI-like enzyme
MDRSPLDHSVWTCLSGPHRAFAEGGDLALRYRRGFSPIAALAEPTVAACRALAAVTDPGEQLSLGQTEPLPLSPEWALEVEAPVLQMVATAPVDERPVEVAPVVLGEADVPAMVALTALTHPGPFGPLTHRLGTYLGIKVDGKLVAMAGLRFLLPAHREISAVCTHPDWQGRGFARLLMTRLMTAIRHDGLTPILHVLESNTTAVGLYERLGFQRRRTVTLLVLRRKA